MKSGGLGTLLCLCLVLSAGAGFSGSIGFDLSLTFDGDSPAGKTLPWLTATFTDIDSGGVQLTMSASGLVAEEFARSFYFNIKPTVGTLDLRFITHTEGTIKAESIISSPDNLKADGEKGLFDLLFEFPTANKDRLPSNDILTSVYIFGSGLKLDAASFDFTNDNEDYAGQYYSAAHVQGIGEGGKNSGWIAATVPEPGSMILLGIGLLGIAGFSRKKFCK